MSMLGAETVLSDMWMQATLSADAGIVAQVEDRVYEGVAPSGVKYPFITYTLQNPEDVNGVGPNARIFVEAQYIVQAISEAQLVDLAPCAVAIDAALDGAEGSPAGGLVLTCQRNAPYTLEEQHEGRIIRHLGGLYTVLVQATS